MNVIHHVSRRYFEYVLRHPTHEEPHTRCERRARFYNYRRDKRIDKQQETFTSPSCVIPRDESPELCSFQERIWNDWHGKVSKNKKNALSPPVQMDQISILFSLDEPNKK